MINLSFKESTDKTWECLTFSTLDVNIHVCWIFGKKLLYSRTILDLPIFNSKPTTGSFQKKSLAIEPKRVDYLELFILFLSSTKGFFGDTLLRKKYEDTFLFF